MKVDIHEQLEDGSRRRIATFFLRGGEIQCDNPVLWKHLMNSNGGVIIGSRGKRYYPRDGIEYLRNLKYQFAGPYLHAGPVEEEEWDREEVTDPMVGAGRAEPDVSSLTTVKTAPQPTRERGGGRPRRTGTGRVRERVLFSELRSRGAGSRDSRLSREDLEAVCGGVYRAAAAFRGLAYDVARVEMDDLLATLTRLVGVDRAETARAFESREAYLELCYQPPSRQNYEKLWARASRYWDTFLEVLETGDLEQALWPLFMTWEAMRCLPQHRAGWLRANEFEPVAAARPAGTSLEEVVEAWQTHGVGAFRKRGLSRTLLAATSSRAGSRFEAAVAAFREAAFGRSEAEVRAALSIDPGFVEARLALGDILRRLDQAGAALVELQRTVELETLRARGDKAQARDPASLLRLARTRLCIGKTLLSEGRVRTALSHLNRSADAFERLVRLDEADTNDEAFARTVHEEKRVLHGLLERVYRDLGDVERADHHRKRVAGT